MVQRTNAAGGRESVSVMKGEVVSSILTGSTSNFRNSRCYCQQPKSPWQRRVRSASYLRNQRPPLNCSASGRRSFIGNDPSQDRLDRDEAGIVRLAHDCQELEPEFVVGTLQEVANGAGDEIWCDHRRRCGASLEAGGNGGVQRREHGGCDVRTVEVGNEIAEHVSDHIWDNSVPRPARPRCRAGRHCTSGVSAPCKSTPTIRA